MGKTISANLFDISSLREMQKQILEYKESFERKCEVLVEELAKKGQNVALERISQSPLGKTITLSLDIEPSKVGCQAILVATGQIVEQEGYEPFSLLFAVEFGAGIHYNPEPNPYADDLGMGVGTFPGQVHAFQNEGWYYLGEDEKWHHTFGVDATMPMNGAVEEIVRTYKQTVKEVFG